MRNWFVKQTAKKDNLDSERIADAQRLLDKGAECEDVENTDEALRCYLEATRLDPQLGRAHFCAGLLLLAQGNADEALIAFEKALVIKPDSAGTYLNIGNACMQFGRAEQAINAYRAAIALKPDFANAELGLGSALGAVGKADEAIKHFQRALAIEPGCVLAHYNIGRALLDLGESDKALATFHNILADDPRHFDAQMAIASIFLNRQQVDEAASAYRNAMEIDPDRTEPLFNLALIDSEKGNVDEAVARYREVLQLRPDFIEAHNNLGTLLKKTGFFREAVESYFRALTLKPDYPEVLNNLGNAQTELGQYEDALVSYQKAIDLRPDFADAWGNMGVACHGLRKFDKAVEYLKKSIELRADHAGTLANLGGAQQEMGLFEDALMNYRKALDLQPENADILSNVGILLKDRGSMEEALVYCRKALDLEPDNLQIRGSNLFIMNYLAELPGAQLLDEAKKFGVIAKKRAKAFTHWTNPPDKKRTLRIGMVSGDFIAHPVGYFLEGVLQSLAQKTAGRLEFVGYPTRPNEDLVTAHIKSCCCSWHPVKGLRDEEFARLVREDGIDILIDLSGYTGHHRIPVFAWKAAPLQVTWLGYFATTGLDAMDYLIADPWTLPESQEVNFSEAIWRLPESRLCFTPPSEQVEVSPLPALGNGYITFGCFNHLTKVNAHVIALWSRILNAVPRSKLYLKATQLREHETRRLTEERFASHGIPSDRLILEAAAPRNEYFAAYRKVDFALDPFPYTGGTTTVEALWMGVPVLSLAGECFLARQGVGFLMNAGLPDWVASDPEDYVARAVSHASDTQRLAALRRELRAQVLASPIFDADRFSGHFEAALRGMWEKWCGQQHPSHVATN